MIASSLLVLSLLGADTLLPAEVTENGSPRTSAFELRLGGFKPLIDREASLTGHPYEEVFGAGAMLLAEIELERQLWQRFGSVAVGASVGYAEKYGAARDSAGNPASERTALKVAPLKLLGIYRFDYAALRWNIPLVPYVKAGLAYTPWWTTKGGQLEFVDGKRSAGGQWGYVGTLGLSLQLDFFEPRLARDFASDMGVNHSYLFAEYVYQDVNDFGAAGPDMSSRHWMFGLTLEY